MSSAYARLDQAVKDLLDAYIEIDDELQSKHSEDEDSFSNAMIEALETSLESALEEHDISTGALAGIFSNFTEALEQLDPSAFDADEDDEYVVEDVDDDIDDDVDPYEMDDDDIDDDELGDLDR